MDPELIKLIGQGGLSVGTLIVLGKVVWKVGLRMIAALDRMMDKLDSHTKTDVAAWAEVSARIQQNSKETAAQIAQAFMQVTQTMEQLRASMAEDLSAIRQDLAVLGTRVDVAMELTPIPEASPRRARSEADRSERGERPETYERHERVPVSGVPVVERTKKW